MQRPSPRERYLYNLLQSTVGATNARRYFVEHFASLPEAAGVLDIGCGPGTLIPFLPRHVARYVGFDPNPNISRSPNGALVATHTAFSRRTVPLPETGWPNGAVALMLSSRPAFCITWMIAR